MTTLAPTGFGVLDVGLFSGIGEEMKSRINGATAVPPASGAYT
jgi:hypothetical protein